MTSDRKMKQNKPNCSAFCCGISSLDYNIRTRPIRFHLEYIWSALEKSDEGLDKKLVNERIADVPFLLVIAVDNRTRYYNWIFLEHGDTFSLRLSLVQA